TSDHSLQLAVTPHPSAQRVDHQHGPPIAQHGEHLSRIAIRVEHVRLHRRHFSLRMQISVTNLAAESPREARPRTRPTFERVDAAVLRSRIRVSRAHALTPRCEPCGTHTHD